jgi:hypothetical protein
VTNVARAAYDGGVKSVVLAGCVLALVVGVGASAAGSSRPSTFFTLTATNSALGEAVFTLRCHPSGGNILHPERACVTLDRKPQLLLRPTPFTCRGGPFSWWGITIKGRIQGKPLFVTTSTCWTPQMSLLRALGIGRTPPQTHLVCSAGTPLSPKGLPRCRHH